MAVFAGVNVIEEIEMRIVFAVLRRKIAHAFGWGALVAGLFPIPAAAADLLIANAKVYAAPGAAPVENASVLIREDRIAFVGSAKDAPVAKDAVVVDAAGGALLAGFWTATSISPNPSGAVRRNCRRHDWNRSFGRCWFATASPPWSTPARTRAIRCRCAPASNPAKFADRAF